MSSVLLTDFYKTSHHAMYPVGLEMVFNNCTARGSRVKNIDHVVVFGIQYYIKKYLIEDFNRTFFSQPKDVVIKQYQRRMDNALGKGVVTTNHLEELYDLGYLPLEIRALPEGSLCPIRIPFITVKNTDDRFGWLPNYLETLQSASTWQSITSATIALEYKKILSRYAEETSDNPDFVQFQAHDFSMRGMSSVESCNMSGAGHLTSFVGTDTIPAIDFLEEFYGADSDKELVGCSVPASEHSVSSLTTALYKDQCEGEYEYFRHLITDVYPNGIISLVSDTYDYWRVLTEFMPKLKEKILSRDGKVVIRPDSGDPIEIICGKEYEEFESFDDAKQIINNRIWVESNYGSDLSYLKNTYQYDVVIGDYFYKMLYTHSPYNAKFQVIKRTPEEKGTVELLYEIFGGHFNSKCYKELDPHIGLIYGDSITLDRAEEICRRLKNKGFSSTNVVFGVGSFSYQYQTRDTFGQAVKATAAIVDGESYEIFKDPKTDSGLKKSARGLLAVLWNNEKKDYQLVEQASAELERSNWNCLQTVFLDGKLIKEYSLSEIRKRIERSL